MAYPLKQKTTIFFISSKEIYNPLTTKENTIKYNEVPIKRAKKTNSVKRIYRKQLLLIIIFLYPIFYIF